MLHHSADTRDNTSNSLKPLKIRLAAGLVQHVWWVLIPSIAPHYNSELEDGVLSGINTPADLRANRGAHSGDDGPEHRGHRRQTSGNAGRREGSFAALALCSVWPLSGAPQCQYERDQE